MSEEIKTCEELSCPEAHGCDCCGWVGNDEENIPGPDCMWVKIAELEAELAAANKKITDISDALLDAFTQSCWYNDDKLYDTRCLSSYEHAASVLEDAGLIKSVNSRIYVDIEKEKP